MHVMMVKKELLDGSPCQKCAQAEALLRRRGLWDRIDEVILAREADPESPGMKLAKARGVELAPFFVVTEGDREEVYTSVLEVISQRLAPAAAAGSAAEAGGAGSTGGAGGPPSEDEVAELNRRFEGATPLAILKHVLERYGKDAGIAFSGAEDVALIDLAASSGLSFSVFTLDTGRLHPETYRFIDKVRSHYGVGIDLVFPQQVTVEELVRKKGLFSFYDDGHGECCGIRKVEPLGRVLSKYRAWLTGQRRDQSPTRTNVPLFELDRAHPGKDGAMLKANPMAAWSLAETWDYLRGSGGPTNELHERGFISIGCEPCTRATGPGEHERAGRWWWEEATKRECGLHVK
jgi:phosphoadenosine phosphosulfate reductase